MTHEYKQFKDRIFAAITASDPNDIFNTGVETAEYLDSSYLGEVWWCAKFETANAVKDTHGMCISKAIVKDDRHRASKFGCGPAMIFRPSGQESLPEQ